MIKSPSTKSCGNIPITKIIEIKVPLPNAIPIDEIVGSEESKPIAKPADARIEPDVNMVGNAKLRDCFIASNLLIFRRNSAYLFVITIA